MVLARRRAVLAARQARTPGSGPLSAGEGPSSRPGTAEGSAAGSSRAPGAQPEGRVVGPFDEEGDEEQAAITGQDLTEGDMCDSQQQVHVADGVEELMAPDSVQDFAQYARDVEEEYRTPEMARIMA